MSLQSWGLWQCRLWSSRSPLACLGSRTCAALSVYCRRRRGTRLDFSCLCSRIHIDQNTSPSYRQLPVERIPSNPTSQNTNQSHLHWWRHCRLLMEKIQLRLVQKHLRSDIINNLRRPTTMKRWTHPIKSCPGTTMKMLPQTTHFHPPNRGPKAHVVKPHDPHMNQ